MRQTSRRRTALITAVVVIGASLVAWVTWAHAVVQTPRVESPAPVDAVLVLGGLNTPERTERALAMVSAGLTDTVVLSVPNPISDRLAAHTCRNPPAGVHVLCFNPDPPTTRGEARELGRLAARYGWTRVAVVTSKYHVSRSRLIIGRCYTGGLLMVPSTESVSLKEWAFQYLYQTAGYVKAEFLRGC